MIGFGKMLMFLDATEFCDLRMQLHYFSQEVDGRRQRFYFNEIYLVQYDHIN